MKRLLLFCGLLLSFSNFSFAQFHCVDTNNFADPAFNDCGCPEVTLGGLEYIYNNTGTTIEIGDLEGNSCTDDTTGDGCPNALGDNDNSIVYNGLDMAGLYSDVTCYELCIELAHENFSSVLDNNLESSNDVVQFIISAGTFMDDSGNLADLFVSGYSGGMHCVGPIPGGVQLDITINVGMQSVSEGVIIGPIKLTDSSPTVTSPVQLSGCPAVLTTPGDACGGIENMTNGGWDLTMADALVDPAGAGDTYEYWSNATDAGDITNMTGGDICTPYGGMVGDVIYVRVTDADGCIAVAEVELTGGLAIGPGSDPMAVFCSGDEADFDLTNWDAQAGAGNNVIWFSGDPFAGGTAIASPMNANLPALAPIFALVEGPPGFCDATLAVTYSTTSITADATATDMSGTADDDLIVCEGDPFTLVDNGGGIDTWDWDNGTNSYLGETSNMTMVAAATAADGGTWNLTVTDSNSGCSDVSSVTIMVLTPPTATDDPITLCESDAMMYDLAGNHDATVGGGNTVTWWDGDPANGGADLGSYNSVDLTTALTVDGTLWAVVDDGMGCTSSVTITLTLNTSPTATDAPITVCENDAMMYDLTQHDGTVGGGSSVAYWDGDPDNGGADLGTYNPVDLTTALTVDGTLWAVVDDGTGCTASVMISLTLNTSPTATAVPINACAGADMAYDLTQHDAAVDAGGAGMVNWYDGDPDPAAGGTDLGTYNPVDLTGVADLWVLVTDGNGCTDAVQIAVTTGAAGPATEDVTLTVCDDGSGAPNFTLEDAADAAGASNTSGVAVDAGAGLTVDYFGLQSEAMDAAGFPTGSGLTSPYSSGTGSVWVRVTDGSGCFSVVELMLVVAPPPNVNLVETDMSGTPDDGSICAGEDFNLEEDGGDAASWMWTSGTGATFDDMVGNPVVVSGAIDQEIITVVVTDASGCTASTDYTITVAATPTPTDPDFIACEGDAMMYDLTQHDATVGTGTVTWCDRDPAAGGTDLPDFTMADLTTIPELWVKLDDGSGCIGAIQVTYTVNTDPTNQTTELTACDDGSGNGIFTLTDAEDVGGAQNTGGGDVDDGNTMTVTYHQSQADAESNTGAEASPYTGAAGSLWVRVEDPTSGCFTNVEITLVLSIPPVSGIMGNTTVCEGDDLTLTEDNDGMPWTWDWDTPAGPVGPNATGVLSVTGTVQANDEGTYTVTVTDVNGCTASSEVMVMIDPASPLDPELLETITSTMDNTDGIICEGDEVDLSELSGLDIEWLLPDGSNFTTDDDPAAFTAVLGTHDGTWTVQLEGGGGGGCATGTTFDIVINPTPVPMWQINKKCENGDLEFEETSGIAMVEWYSPGSFPGTAASMANPYTLNPAVAGMDDGTWTVVVTDANGCTGTDEVEVTLDPEPTVMATCTTPLCEGQQLDLDEIGGDGDDWAWEHPDGTLLQATGPSMFTIPQVFLADAGVYTVTVTDANGCTASGTHQVDIGLSTTLFDDCSAPQSLVINDPCTPLDFSGDTSGACPEIATGTCDQNVDPTIWFSFTTLPGTTTAEFTNVNGAFEVITPECPTGTSNTIIGGCFMADAQVGVTGGTTYLISGAFPGGEGMIGFTLALLEAPMNDLCTSAAPAMATTTTGSTACASADGNLCGGTDHVVFYSYTVVGPGSVTLEINAMATTAGDLAYAAWTDCGGSLLDPVNSSESCGGGAIVVECVPAGTMVTIPVGSSDGAEGEFEIMVTETVTGMGAAGDACDDAQPETAMECVAVTIDGSTTDACPELFPGCNVDQDPTVWHSITLPPGTTSLDITNLQNAVNIGIWGDCSGGNLLTCIMGDMTDITTFTDPVIISASIPGGQGSYSFDILAKVAPANDLCDGAFVGNGTGTTCCASNDGVGCNQNNSVWHIYTPSDPDAAVTVQVTGASIGSMGVDVFTGDCAGPTPVMGGACVLGTMAEVTATCFDGDVIVQVSSTDEASCGDYMITFVEEPPCSAGADCGSAIGLAPSTGGGPDCADVCNNNVCSPGTCGMNTIYFEVMTDGNATAMNVQVEGDFTPIICIYQDACDGPQVGGGTGDVAVAAVSGNLTYIVAVGIAAGDPGDFQVCVSTFESLSDCATDSELNATRPEYPAAPPEGPYCPGETVNFCYEVNFQIDGIGSGNNCQWLQGIVPVIGGGWDIALNDPATQGPGGSQWFDEGNVSYQVNNPVLGLTSECTGALGLEYGGGGLSNGDVLPGGWWYTSPGGAGCANDGNPNTMWGLPGGCGGSQSVSFCFNLTVRNVVDESECEDECASDLKVHIFTFADGETGCWTNVTCAADIPVTFDGLMDCGSLITVELVSADQEICSGQSAMIEVAASDGSTPVILATTDNPNVTGETLNGTFPGGGLINDVLINTGTSPETVTYEFFAQSPNPDSQCNGPRLIVEVIVYPALEIEFDEPYDVCFDGQEDITAMVSGGSGGGYMYAWDNGDSGATTQAPQSAPGAQGAAFYTVTVTDAIGCTGEATVEYIVRPEVTGDVVPSVEFACKDGFLDEPEICALISSGNLNGPFTYEWIYDSDLNVDEQGECMFINEEASDVGSYVITVIITDKYGCMYQTEEVDFLVTDGPEIDFAFPSCVPGSNEYQITVCDDSGGSPEFTLWDEFYTFQFDGPFQGNCVDFFVQPFDVGSIGYAAYVVQATDENGCIATDEITLLPPPILEFNPDPIIGCEGQPLTIEALNGSDYEFLNWSTGDSGVNEITATFDEDDNIFITALDEFGCETIFELFVDIDESPTAGITGSLSICNGSSTTLETPAENGWSYTWSTGETTNAISVAAAGSYGVTVSSANGCSATDIVNVEVGTSLEPSITGEAFCDVDGSTIISTGTTFASYMWADAAGNVLTGANPWEAEVMTGGTYFLTVSDGACTGTGMIVIDEVASPTGTATDAEVCNSTSTGQATTLDLNASAPGATAFLDENGIPVPAPTSVDFNGQAQGTLVYTAVFGAMAPCADLEVNFNINVLNCACPNPTINNPGNFCNDGSTEQNLNLLLTSTTETDGFFSVLNADGTASAIMPDANNLITVDATTAAGDYLLVYTLNNPGDPSCPDTDQETFTISQAPDPQIPITSTIVCNSADAGDDTVVNLDDFVTYTGIGTWQDQAGTEITNTTIDFDGMAPGSLLFFFQTNDAVDPCTDVQTQFEIVVADCACPLIGLTLDETICDTNDPLDLNGFLAAGTEPGGWTVTMTPDPNYTLPGSGLFDPAGVAEGVYEFTYALSSPGAVTCVNEVAGTITVVGSIDAPIIQGTQACNSNLNPVAPLFIDLTEFEPAGFEGTGTWVGPPDYNGGMIPDITAVSFLDTMPGSFIFQYVLPADAPCEDATVNFLISVQNCDCPLAILQPAAPLCNDGGASFVNLNDQIGPGSADGAWSYNSGPETNVILTDGEFDATGLMVGDYLFDYVLTDPLGCEDTFTLTISVGEPTTFDLPSNAASVCNEESAIAPTFFNFNAISQGIDGSWVAPDDFPGDASNFNLVDFTGLPPGDYTFTYNGVAVSPCSAESEDFVITLLTCGCPTAILEDGPPMCNDDDTVELVTLANPANAAGTFTAEDAGGSPIAINNNVFDAAGLDPGIYTIIYTLDDTPALPCLPADSIEIEVFEVLTFDFPDNLTACNTASTEGETFVDFEAVSAGISGAWSAPDDYPGDDADFSNISFDGLDINTSYVFTFTGDPNGPCDSFTEELIVTVVDCNCPIVSISGDQILCTDSAPVDVNSLSGPANDPGTYSAVDASGDPVDLINDMFDPSGLSAGEYFIIYTLDDMVPADCTQEDSVTIAVFELLTFDFPDNLTACNTMSTEGETFVDFESISAGVSGTWTAPADYPGDASDFSNISFDGLDINTSYAFTFTGDANGPCDPHEEVVIITIVDCDCPIVSISGMTTLCTDSAPVDVNSLSGANNDPGTFSAVDMNGDEITLTNDMFDPSGLASGEYFIIYTLDDAVPVGCTQQDSVMFVVNSPPTAGLVGNPVFLCANESDLITLADLLDGEDPGGQWSETSVNNSQGGAFDQTTGTFNTDGQAAGTYTFEYIFDNIAPCDPVSETVVVEIEEIPVADAGDDSELNCGAPSADIGGAGSSTGANFEYIWVNAQGDTISQGQDLDIVVSAGGDYMLTVLNTQTGCTESDVVSIAVDNDFPNFIVSATDSPCFGYDEGSLGITINGGTPPYLFSIDGINFDEVTTFENLAPGTYNITLEDGLECTVIQENFIIAEPGPFVIEAGDNNIVDIGESAELTLGISDPGLIAMITWTQDGEVICEGTVDDCFNFSVEPPLVPTQYCVEVIDTSGCIGVDCRTLQSRAVRDIYIPNIITDEDDSDVNNWFFVNSDAFVESIPQFLIYDRWGELIFSTTEAQPNVSTSGWDGSFNNKRVAQGVYVYLIEVAYGGDDTEIFTGTVTVTR